MPLVLARSQRPEDAHLKHLRNQAAARHRALRLNPESRAAAEIEYKQKANWERNIKKPLLDRPKPEPGWSTPEWDVARACWLAYFIEDTTKWVCWDAFNEKWIDLSEYDKNCSSPSSSEQSKSERVSPTSTDLQERSDTPASNGSRFTFKTVAQTIMKVLALRKTEDPPENV